MSSNSNCAEKNTKGLFTTKVRSERKKRRVGWMPQRQTRNAAAGRVNSTRTDLKPLLFLFPFPHQEKQQTSSTRGLASKGCTTNYHYKWIFLKETHSNIAWKEHKMINFQIWLGLPILYTIPLDFLLNFATLNT